MYAAQITPLSVRITPEPLNDGLEEFDVGDLPQGSGRYILVNGKIELDHSEKQEAQLSSNPTEVLLDAIIAG